MNSSKISTCYLQGQFNFAEVVIRPLDYNSNLVTVRMKEDLGNVVTNTGPHVISDDNLPILVRQLAVHTNVSPFYLISFYFVV